MTSGTIWTITGYGLSQTLRLGSNLVLAYLLSPEAFGLMLLVNVFIQGLGMFSDIGVGPSIIHNKRGDDPAFLDTAWTVQVVRGFLLWIASWIAASFVAAYYEEPRLSALIPVAGLTAAIAGFNSTKLFTVNRHMILGRRTLIDLCAQVVSIVVMIAWSLVDRSVWSLVAGGIANSLTKLALSHWALPGRSNRFHLETRAYREMFTFGKWIFVSTAITFFATQIDRLLVGKLLPIDEVGVYGTALNLASLPSLIIATLAGTVVYPVLAASARSDPASLSARTTQIRGNILPCGLFAILGLALLSPAFFRTLYDERYADAGWITVTLMVPFWFLILSSSSDRALLALGDTRALALCNLVSLVGKVAGCVVGFRIGGLFGFILGLTTGNAACQIVIQIVLARHAISIWRQDVTLTLLGLLMGGAGVLLPRWGAVWLGERWRHRLDLAVAALVLVPFGAWLWSRMRGEISRP